MTKYSDILKIFNRKIDVAMNKSKETGKEYGFNICSNGVDITATEIVDGNIDSITLEDTCPRVKIGSFHVHPMSLLAIPSTKDISNLEDNDEEKFVCIGVNLNDSNGTRKIVKCFDRMYREESYEN